MRSVKQMLCSSPLTVLAIICLSLLVIWPTLVEQHWGLLDDGVTLAVAKELQRSWYIPASPGGRYFPAYFIYYALVYSFSGTEISGYYAVQALVLILTNLLLYTIVHLLSGSRGLGWLAVCLFLTSSTMAENYYTISKQEPRLLLFLLISLYCFIRADLATEQFHAHVGPRRLPCGGALMWGIASVVTLMIAYLTKETTLMVLPASCLWVLAAVWLEKGGARRPRTRAALGYLGINLLTFTLFVVAAYVYTPTPLPWAGSHTGIGLSLTPSAESFLYYIKVNFDVLLLVGLALGGVLCWSMLRPARLSELASYAIFCLLCAAAYSALFVWVWKLSVAYYLLPVAAWSAIAISLLLKLFARDHPRSLAPVSIMSILVLGLILSRVYAIPSLYNAGVALNAWHRVNGRMLSWVSTLAENSRLLFMNVPNDHEYIYEAGLLLRILYGRTNIMVAGTANIEDLLQQARSGDFVVINFGAEANRHVWVRAVRTIPSLESSRQLLVSAPSGLRLEEAFLARSEKKLLPPFSTRLRPFVLGWAGYRVVRHLE